MAVTYTITTNFGEKDALPSGDSDKVIKGAQFTTEFNNIQTAFGLCAPAASPTFTGTATIPTATITSLTVNGTSFDPVNYAPLASPTFTGLVTVPTNGLRINTTTVTASASDLNKLAGVTATTTELNYVDVTTLGTVQANKAVTAASSAINFNNFDMTNVDINSGAIDGVTIGAASAAAGTFTTATATTSLVDRPIQTTEVAVSGTTFNLDLSQGFVFQHTGISGDLTFTISNAPTSGYYSVFLFIAAHPTVNTYTVSGPGILFPPSIPAETDPASSNGGKFLELQTRDGSNWLTRVSSAYPGGW